ncbi:MAG: hypothetical protein COT84_04860 [Chlamydiae bacterium CG10_big_fil_rev_8_21_14_0_10_35_9]|nr:MAG: hypothetical protein COT84_04860 [Chlamydiae bacterium CG10_big_fil_rev_8_21_14_0_10_35_9]
MEKYKKTFYFFLVIFLGLSSCTSKSESIVKPSVLVSIEPYAFFVKKIAGDTLQVKTLIPPSANAHSYEPTPKEVKDAGNADVWFQIGEPIEKAIAPSLQQKNKHLLIYDVKTDIELIGDCCLGHHHKESKDIHVWLSPILMKKQAIAVAKILMNRFPKNASLYRQNLQSLLLELDDLNDEIENLLNPIENKKILVTHPAFGYFCRDYNCEQIAIEFEGKDPLPRKLDETVEVAKNSHVKLIISQPQFSQKSAEVVSRRLQLPIYEFNPYASDYISNMLYLANLVVQSNE